MARDRKFFIDYWLHQSIPYNIKYKECRLPNEKDIEWLNKNDSSTLTINSKPFWVQTTDGNYLACHDGQLYEEAKECFVRLVFEFDKDIIDEYKSKYLSSVDYCGNYIYVCNGECTNFISLSPISMYPCKCSDALSVGLHQLKENKNNSHIIEALAIDPVLDEKSGDNIDRYYPMEVNESKEQFINRLKEIDVSEFILRNRFTGDYLIFSNKQL